MQLAQQGLAARDLAVRQRLENSNFDALICSLPVNVLLLTGYWPVVGCSIAISCRDGRVALLVPEDEDELAEQSWAEEIRTFRPSSLDRTGSALDALHQPFQDLLREMGLVDSRLGLETGEVFEPASYASVNLYYGALWAMLR